MKFVMFLPGSIVDGYQNLLCTEHVLSLNTYILASNTLALTSNLTLQCSLIKQIQSIRISIIIKTDELLHVFTESMYVALQTLIVWSFRSRRIGSLIHRIALKFHWRNVSISLVNTNHTSLRLYEVL